MVRKPEKASGPRLQLDLLDLTASEPQLRGSFEMTSTPTADAAVRSQAQALWRSLNATPEDAMRDSLRLETLESQMRIALEQSKRQGENIATLSSELLAAQRARYLNPFTIFLGLLATVAIGMSLLLWRRSQSQSGPWWGNNGKSDPDDEERLWGHLVDGVNSPSSQSTSVKSGNGTTGRDAFSLKEANTHSSAKANTSRVFEENPSLHSQRDAKTPSNLVDVDSSAEIVRSNVKKQPPLGSTAPPGRSGGMGRVDSTPPPSLRARSAHRTAEGHTSFALSDFAHSGFSSSRLVDAEELFDIQEQADFFLSLGQPDQAIEVLKNHITDNVETSAVAYMDLFDIYHGAGREVDYAELREEFNRVFNAQVPEFAQYGVQSNGLEDFPDVLNKIELAWQQPEDAQNIIEESIFRQPDQFQQPLDMSAYRELMLLYALAKELARPGARIDMLPMSMQSAALPPLAVDKPSAKSEMDFGDELVFALPEEDMLSLVDDPTLNLPKPLIAPSPKSADDGLDFDLSESELGKFDLPGDQKKT